ncbi:hypothetical protein LCGC14_2830160 [marine sediment metagenome]|uniref:Uncharacterized protein n=1 Tax=marine sediment metagenome TaxID=412755 RepID=A0A0F8Z0Y9_9ZZZZ
MLFSTSNYQWDKFTEISEKAFVKLELVEEFIRKAALQPIDGTTLYPAAIATVITSIMEDDKNG